MVYKHYSNWLTSVTQSCLKLVLQTLKISDPQRLLKISGQKTSDLQALLLLKILLKATSGYNLTSEPQTLEAKLPLS